MDKDKKIGFFFLGLVLIMAIITLFLIDAASADPPVYDRLEASSCDCIYAEVGDMEIYGFGAD